MSSGFPKRGQNHHNEKEPPWPTHHQTHVATEARRRPRASARSPIRTQARIRPSSTEKSSIRGSLKSISRREDEIEATDERGRRWYHLRPEPRRRADLIGFNYTWWLVICLLFILIVFLPWGRGWGY